MTSPENSTAPSGHEETLLQGRYRITRCLGSGGMGDVYLADDLRLQRQVAVKSIKQEFCTLTEVRKRIERECVMHAQLGAHPNIITLYDRVDEDGQIHLIIEYVDGTTLKDLIEQARLGSIFLTWRESVSIACQLLEALAKIHAQGIVHRDVKPANIMLTQSDTGAYTAKLMDFGIARLMNPVDGATMLTRQGGSGPGTPIYMSPEQIAGTQFGPLSPASDVYAMGVVLYQMLAKHPPFQGTITDIFHGHLNAPPPPIDCTVDATYPAPLTDVVQRALAKRPSDRYVSAIDFRQALKRVSRAHGAITTLSVANTLPVAAAATVASTVPLAQPVAEPVTTSGWMMRRTTGAQSAGRTVIAIACVLLAIAAVVFGNFFYFRSIASPDAPGDAPQQTATATVPTGPTAPAVTEPVNAAPVPTPVEPPAPAAPTSPEQPMPVSLDAEAKPAPVTEKPVEPAPLPEAEAPKPAATPPKPKAPAPEENPLEDTPDPAPKRAVTPLPPNPQEAPRQTPVPQQTPVPPDVSAPMQDSTPFSERAREQFVPGQAPGNANVFGDIQVRKQPAVKVN